MDCLEFRRICSTEPGRDDPALHAHASECGSCSAFAIETESFDQLLTEALSLPVPPALSNFSVAALSASQDAGRGQDHGHSDGTGDNQHAASGARDAASGYFHAGTSAVADMAAARKPPGRASATRWLAMAAAVVAAVAVSFGAWRVASQPSLADELVAHVKHEPYSLGVDVEPVAAEEVEFVLTRTGARFDVPVGTITYMKTCPFRNQQVAHVVIEGSTGPVTLLLLPDIHVDVATPIDEEGFKGTIVPVGKGSVAIIGNETEPMAPVEELVSRAVAWRI